MCGICGVIKGSFISPRGRAAVRMMSRSMVHRGPDGEGIFGDEPSSPVMLAMRRLAIIDLTGGWQPLFNEDQTIALVANGEVYNHVELRRSLEAQGHRFKTGSDCETIIHLYEQYGLDFVHHLRGMYAFALWDSRRKRLVLARDRMGEKPLYLYEKAATATEPAQLFFASELRTMLASGLIKFDLDPAAVKHYFHYAYVPEPKTPILGIRKLPAGCMMVVDVDPQTGSFESKEQRYWRLDQAPPLEGNPAKLIRQELDRIGELIVRSDVPIAVALSGGVDSSLMAAIARKYSPQQLLAISVGYKGRPRQDERQLAAEFASHLKIPFNEVEVDPQDVIDLFPKRVVWRDDPIADTAGHSYWALARESRRLQAPVLLQGHGGDELFWGYSWVREAVTQSQHKKVHGSAAKSRLMRRFIPTGLSRRGVQTSVLSWVSIAQGCGSFDPDAGSPADQLIYENLTPNYQLGVFANERMFAPEFAAKTESVNPGSWFTIPKPWPQLDVAVTQLICELYLLENGMAQGDRLSMASSVELRLPLCDYRLAEVVIGLRKQAAIERRTPDHLLAPKTWLREASRDLLPEWIFDRPKRGFTPPSSHWLPGLINRYGPALVDGELVANGVITPEMAERLQGQHSQLSPWAALMYQTLVLEYWCRGVRPMAEEAGAAIRELAAVAG